MTAAMQWRTLRNNKRSKTVEQGVTVTDLIIKATAHALASNRSLNAHVDANKVVIKKGVNIGLATSVEDGLLVPVVERADCKGLQDISAEVKRLAAAAKRGVVASNAVGTFTISSLGMFGVREVLPIINPPEAAILGVGAIEKRVRPTPKGFDLREMTILTLAVDHRAVDGVAAAKFLGQIKLNLEDIDRFGQGSVPG